MLTVPDDVVTDAEIRHEPEPTPVAMPSALTVATVGSLDNQLTPPETLPLLLSEKVSVAVNAVVAPLLTVIVAGTIVIPVSVAVVTVMVLVAARIPPYMPGLLIEAEILAVPVVLPAATTPEAEMLATVEAVEVQATELVMSAVVEFE